MKIGFLIYSLGGGGAERVVTNLANELVKSGNEIVIYIFDLTGKRAYDIDSKITIRTCTAPQGAFFVRRFATKICILKKMLQKDEIEILFAFMISMVPYAIFAKPRNCLVIGTERTSPRLHGKKQKLIVNFLSPFCDGFVFQTEGARAFYPKSMREKSVVIQNPVFPISKCREKLGGIHFCAAGRKVGTKDFSTILRAFAIFRKEYAQSKLTFFCDKELEDYLQAEIFDLNLQENIIFRGFVNDLPNEFSAYTAFLFSSWSEGMPNVLMEAMGAGVPCIATDCDFGPRELIQNGVNGILVGVGNAFDMAEAMKYLVENPDKAAEMARRAQSINLTNSVGKIADAFWRYAKNVKDKKSIGVK